MCEKLIIEPYYVNIPVNDWSKLESVHDIYTCQAHIDYMNS